MSLKTIRKYSNPDRVLQLARQYYKKNKPSINRPINEKIKLGRKIGDLGNQNTGLYLSSRKGKKYMLYNGEKIVHFGQYPYEDYTHHHNKTRRNNYIKRASNIRGDWKKNPYSANNLAINLLW